MKKSLSEIFNDAKQEELDILLNEFNSEDISKDIKNSVKNKVFEKTKFEKQESKKYFFGKNRISLIAASLCVVIVLSVYVILNPAQHKDEYTVPQTLVNKFIGDAITGKQQIIYDGSVTDSMPQYAPNSNNSSSSNGSVNSGNACYAAIEFNIKTVAQVKVISATKNKYTVPKKLASNSDDFIVVKLSVIDLIYGDSLPQEIYLKVLFYDAGVFSGFDSFILSLEQVGAENYMAINKTKKRIEYFPNMFELAGVNDLGYGSAIAFKNGKVDVSFWNKVNYINSADKFFDLLDDPQDRFYPVTYGTTVENAKKNILNEIANKDIKNYKYVSFNDLFSEDEKELSEYLKPETQNVWKQEVNNFGNSVTATFTRIINGFLTDEVISANISENGKKIVTKSNVHYDKNDLASIVDIGYVLDNVDIFEIKPSHINVEKGMYCQSILAEGFYLKNKEKVYGIIRIRWIYKHQDYSDFDGGWMDDCYLVYDETGNGVRLERNAFDILFKDNNISYKFDYR